MRDFAEPSIARHIRRRSKTKLHWRGWKDHEGQDDEVGEGSNWRLSSNPHWKRPRPAASRSSRQRKPGISKRRCRRKCRRSRGRRQKHKTLGRKGPAGRTASPKLMAMRARNAVRDGVLQPCDPALDTSQRCRRLAPPPGGNEHLDEGADTSTRRSNLRGPPRELRPPRWKLPLARAASPDEPTFATSGTLPALPQGSTTGP